MTNLRQGIIEAKSAQGIDWESAKQNLALSATEKTQAIQFI